MIRPVRPTSSRKLVNNLRTRSKFRLSNMPPTEKENDQSQHNISGLTDLNESSVKLDSISYTHTK